MREKMNYLAGTPMRGLRVLVAAGSALIVAVACGGPRYPSCDNDEHCNSEGHKGVCVNHVCVQCRADDGCAAGQTCKAGACAAADGWCDEKTPCAAGADCRGNRCQPAVVAAREALECDDQRPCTGSGEKCQNGHCVAPPPGGPGCQEFPAPKFDFESPELKSETRSTLERLAQCLGSGTLKGRRVLLVGHCDARGEYEFNMGLGAQRAETVKTFLVGLGVPASAVSTSSRGKLDAAGTDEAGWSNDRRVDIEVR